MYEDDLSIAVMPFRNLSPEPDTEYFVNGFVEDLTANLTRFASLRVLAIESTFALGHTDESIDDYVDRWGLHFLLQGSVRRGDSDLRVGVQLIR
jgi:adenylate cyclase